jgi:hypothetical protein
VLNLVFLTIAGTLFLFVINYSRGDFNTISFYSVLMEFRGVLSSVQFSYFSLEDFDFKLFRQNIEVASIESIGFNLAYHPLLYFRAFGHVIVSVLLYFFILFIFSLCGLRLIGNYFVLIYQLNFIHFLRHGIDIFLWNIFLYTFILFLLAILMKYANENSV